MEKRKRSKEHIEAEKHILRKKIYKQEIGCDCPICGSIATLFFQPHIKKDRKLLVHYMGYCGGCEANWELTQMK